VRYSTIRIANRVSGGCDGDAFSIPEPCSPRAGEVTSSLVGASESSIRSPRCDVLVAFNRRDVTGSKNVFLRNANAASGNTHEVVVVAAMDSIPSERQWLANHSRECGSFIASPYARMPRYPPLWLIFCEITQHSTRSRPVRLLGRQRRDRASEPGIPLWKLAQDLPTKILGVREPLGYSAE